MVADAQVEDFGLFAEGVEGGHEFLSGGGEVGPVDVEDVDVGSAELAERLSDGDVEVFGGGADGVGGDFGGLVVGGVGGGVFCGDDHFVSRERKEREILVKGRIEG